MDLSDPRVAQQIARLVDQRVAYALGELAPQTRVGVVAAVDTTNHLVSVYIGGAPTASPGFPYPVTMAPAVGNRVRVVMRGADRYVDALLTGTGAVTPAGLYTPVTIYDAANVSSGSGAAIPLTDLELTTLPTNLRAVAGLLRASSSISPTTPTLAQLFGYGEGVPVGWIALQARPAGVLQGTGFVANTGGPNGRSLQYRTNQASGGGVVNLIVSIVGYWK